MYHQGSTSTPPSSAAIQTVDSSSTADVLGSHYNQGVTTSDITLVVPQRWRHNIIPHFLPPDFQFDSSPSALSNQPSAHFDYHGLRDITTKYDRSSTFTPPSSAAIQTVDSSSAADELGSHYSQGATLSHITLVAPQMQPHNFPPLDIPLLDFQFVSSPSALSNQPNDLGARPVMDHTTDPTPQVRCVFKMCRPEPNNDDPIELRRENLIELGLSLRTGPDKASLPWKFIRTSNIRPAERSGIRRRRASLDLVLDVVGATTGIPFASACPRCSKKVHSGPPNYSLFDFVAKDNLVQITGGNARIGFRFRCLPRHHGTTDREYRLSVTISDRGRILGQYQYPNWLRIVHHLNRGKSRPLVALQQSNETSSVIEFGESEESHGALLNAHFSSGSTSGTSAGGSLPVHPSWTSAQRPVSNVFTQIHRADEEFEPGWRGGSLPAPASAARSNNNNRIHETFPVLSHINPRRGPIKGGDEIYLIARNIPPTTDLYARFGSKIVPTSHIAPGVLSCRLPAAVQPGVVEVTLCQAPSLRDEGYGKSLVSFQYEEDSSEALTAWFNGGNTIDPGIRIGSDISPGILGTSHLHF